jgi:hypothetical protein
LLTGLAKSLIFGFRPTVRTKENSIEWVGF